MSWPGQISNIAFDMAISISQLQFQSIKNSKKARVFLIKYQDRINYVTDHELAPTSILVVLNLVF